ncbi:MAG: hypothetical protein EKK41_23180 [Hyphomicrobiales bacterium]|nr:MAG: hypothetical protein EKK41_23180 [Hyphomicrobiales bacterium]
MRKMQEIDRLTGKLNSDLSAWLLARQSQIRNETWRRHPSDISDVSRKLMALDSTLTKLSALIPEEFIADGSDAPQEYAPAILAILKTETALINGGLQ